MSRLELLNLLYSIQALLESGDVEKAKALVEKILAELEGSN